MMMIRSIIVAAGLSASLTGPATAATLQANAFTAVAILGLAKSGDRIVLSGDLGRLTLARRRFEPPLMIDASRATITGLNLNGVEGVVICGGVWLNADVPNGAAIRIDRSAGVRIERARFVGPGERAGGQSQGYGVQVLNAKDIAVIDSVVTGFRSGVTMYDVEGFAVERNTFQRMSADGFIGGSVRKGMLADNSASGFHIIKDEHPDGIQLFSPAGLPASSDVVITRNRITGDTEGIGLYPGTKELGYDRITITNNDIAVSYPPAIAVYGVRGLVLKDNKVRTLPGAPNRASIHEFDSTGVDRTGNTVGPGGGNDSADDTKRTRRDGPPHSLRPPLAPSGQASCPVG